MRETVHIKALLIEGRHDALIAFHKRYNKLFFSKLLLRLGEGIIQTYKPSLALFDEQAQSGNKDGRVVSIRIHKAKSPRMFAFYESLPHGARMAVMVNLMNNYVQLAEADPKMMEQLFWGDDDQKPEAAPVQKEAPVKMTQEQLPTKSGEGSATTVDTVLNADAAGKNPNEVKRVEQQLVVDPLIGLDTGL